MNCRAERGQFEWFLNELERTRQAAFSGDFSRDGSAKDKHARLRIFLAHLLQKIRDPRPRWIGVDHKKLRRVLRRQRFRISDRDCDLDLVLRGKLLQC